MIAAPAQLRLMVGKEHPRARFDELPEATQAKVLALLAHLIAKGVWESEDADD